MHIIIPIRTCVIFCMFDWSGKNGEKSGNFDILCEWQPCLHMTISSCGFHCHVDVWHVKLLTRLYSGI